MCSAPKHEWGVKYSLRRNNKSAMVLKAFASKTNRWMNNEAAVQRECKTNKEIFLIWLNKQQLDNSKRFEFDLHGFDERMAGSARRLNWHSRDV